MRPGAGRRGVLLAALFLLPAAAVPASDELRLGGSVRTVAAVLDNYDEPLLFGEGNEADGLSVTVLRLTAEGERGATWAWEIHLLQDLLYSTAPAVAPGAGVTAVAASRARYRALDLSRTWADDGDLRATLSLDRLNGRGSRGAADATLGRQAINFSQAWFWNPLDIFLPFDPEAFDRSYKPGVDALRLDVELDAFSALTFVAAAGSELRLARTEGGLEVEAVDFSDEPWYGSALLARGRTTLRHWDLTLQGGKVYGGRQVGAGFSGEAGPFGLRGEATYLFADDDDSGLIEDHAKAVVGADRRFESSLYLTAEYFYNGAGEDDDLALALARVAVGETTNLGEHLVGLLASYEIHPLLLGQVSWIHSLSDGSNLVSPLFSWSVADEAECLFGAILAFGDRPETVTGQEGEETLELRSEFGSSPHTYFLELIFYF